MTETPVRPHQARAQVAWDERIDPFSSFRGNDSALASASGSRSDRKRDTGRLDRESSCRFELSHLVTPLRASGLTSLSPPYCSRLLRALAAGHPELIFPPCVSALTLSALTTVRPDYPRHPLNLYAGHLASYPGEGKGGGDGDVGKDAAILCVSILILILSSHTFWGPRSPLTNGSTAS